MSRLIVQRLFQSVLVLLLMSLAVYGLLGFMPGDPIDLMVSADPNLSEADAARMKVLYGLDQPLLERWWHWLLALLGGDLGYSRLYASPVIEVLGPALVNTLLLLGLSLLLTVSIALPIGVWAALKPYSGRDYLINGLAFAGISLPPFWLALMLIGLFAVQLGWLPAGGSPTLPENWGGLQYLILPVATLTLCSIGGHTRFMRGAMLEVLHQDYIRTARAKGASRTRMVMRHALRNALLPTITVLGMELGSLFSGALIIETVFAWPGMGKLIYDAIMSNDYNLALATLLLATFVTLCGNLLADLTHGWLDPRIRHPR